MEANRLILNLHIEEGSRQLHDCVFKKLQKESDQNMGTEKTCFALSLGFILWILNIQMSCLFLVANWWIQLWSLSCHAFCLLVHFSWILWAISGNHQIAWGLQDSITTIDDAIPSFQIRVLYCRHFFVFCGHSFLRAILHLLFPKSKQFTTSQIFTLPPTAGFMILPQGKAPSLHRSSKYPWYPQGPSSLQIRLQCTMIAIAKEVMLSRTKSVNLMAAHFEVWTWFCLLGIY